MGDRVLVMNAGRAEQLAEPWEISQHPATLFVAAFIGRPPMNFIETQYRTEAGQAFLVRDGVRWEVTAQRDAIEVQAREGNVILGVGPADIYPLALAPKDSPLSDALPAQVDLVQPLARQKIVELKLLDLTLKMVVPGAFQVQPGQPLGVVMDRRALHLFNPATGRAIA